MDKSLLRTIALARRDALSAEQREAAAQAIGARDVRFTIRHDAIVASYTPIRSEIDPTPLMLSLAARGARLALPCITEPDAPLAFREWKIGDALRPGRFDIGEPPLEAPIVTPDIVLVPLAAFDRAGHRIGYGAGFYDRTLEQLRAAKPVVAIGLAFAAQEVATIPAAPHDARLDYVLTENEVIDFRS